LSFWKRKKETASSSGGGKNRVQEFFPLVAGTILTLLAILIARQRISAVEKNILGRAAPTEIVVAADSIPSGSTFSLENLAKKSIPSDGTTGRNVPASDFELLLGAKAKVEISGGEPVLWTDVEEPFDVDRFSLLIPKGLRAITMDADTKASFSGLIRPGDHVDILRETGDGKGSYPFLFDVPVIAVDRLFSPPSTEEEGKEIATLTMSVTTNEAALLSAAAREGKISWLLRNPGDRGRPPKREHPRAGLSSPVEIWKGGIREEKTPLPSKEREHE
jgi:Flp pilus assembly protein CpaB